MVTIEHVRALFDPVFYAATYADVRGLDIEPFDHFYRFGADELRRPNRWWDGVWYLKRYPDVAELRVNPIIHYIEHGAAELRDPSPLFNAAYYADRHPEAASNPLAFHLAHGERLGFPTSRPVDVAEYLPSTAGMLAMPENVAADVVIPVYRGEAETRACLESVLGDPERLPGRVVVIDDASPEPSLVAWLDRLAAERRIVLLRNEMNLGFVLSVNRGMREAVPRDAILLNSDTVVPAGWARRLAAHAHAAREIASVSPLSNNATLCGYPTLEGGKPALGLTVAELDAACREANAGRAVPVPVTVGFCMYIKRAAIDEVGLFDAALFGRGYGEEADFCFRARRRGWSHRLACDVYVHHEGEVSFGKDSAESRSARERLSLRYADYERTIAMHLRTGDADPFRHAVTATLLRRSGLPTLLFVTHGLGGGVRQHIDEVIARVRGRANVLLLTPRDETAEITFPDIASDPPLTFPADRPDAFAAWLASANVTRAHVHHTLGLELDLSGLLDRLGVPYDVTVHDWLAICPQVNLLPWLDGHYCGEPGPAECNACIAERPSNFPRDILAWRARHRPLFLGADRVICPTEDVRRRLARHGLAERAVVVPHEAGEAGRWPMAAVPPPRGPLRVLLIGVLAAQKGRATVLSVAATADPSAIALHLIGDAEEALPPWAAGRIAVGGRYEHADLPALIAKSRPHVAWFPAQWPETYSYTLTAAIEAGLPIVASDMGAFADRLAGRPRTWLVDPAAPAAEWLSVFAEVADALEAGVAPASRRRPARPDFYRDGYVRPCRAGVRGPVDLRREGATSVVIVPERSDDGGFSPCAYIRLLLPLDHPKAGEGLNVVVADAAEALRYRADIMVTQRHAVPTEEAAAALRVHCNDSGARLVYDLDDDLLDIPADHADAARLRPLARIVETLARRADALLVSTPVLAKRFAGLRRDAVVVPNGLDERLWQAAAPSATRTGPLRVLMMGTATHGDDLALILPALERARAELGERVRFDLIGMTDGDLPEWIDRIVVPPVGGASYAAFVHWITHQPAWHVGLTPLADTRFNAAKSAIKTLDYAALGLAVLASDVGPYRGSLAGAGGGMLLPNTVEAWFDAVASLARNPRQWHALAHGARAAFLAEGTLAAQAERRRAVWRDLLAETPVPARARRRKAA